MAAFREVLLRDMDAQLKAGPPVIACDKCGEPMFWTVWAMGREVGTPIDAVPNPHGKFAIIGFGTIPVGNAVRPYVIDVADLKNLIPKDRLPEWARDKRWSHHGNTCNKKLAGILSRKL